MNNFMELKISQASRTEKGTQAKASHHYKVYNGNPPPDNGQILLSVPSRSFPFFKNHHRLPINNKTTEQKDHWRDKHYSHAICHVVFRKAGTVEVERGVNLYTSKC